MLTSPEAAEAFSLAAARYETQIAQAIPAGDAGLRAAIIGAITLGVMVSRHLIKSDDLASADPAHVISLLRPCINSLTAAPRRPGSQRLEPRDLHRRGRVRYAYQRR